MDELVGVQVELPQVDLVREGAVLDLLDLWDGRKVSYVDEFFKFLLKYVSFSGNIFFTVFTV